MTRNVGLSILLFSASLAIANAQSSNGTYRGQVRLTKTVERLSGADYCMASGTPIVFRTSGATIFLDHRTGLVFSGPLAANGSFQISGLHPAGQTGRWIVGEWTGAIKGSTIEGNSIGRGPGRDCYHSFSARRV